MGGFGDVIRQKLQGDKPVQGYVLGLVNDTHAAATQLLNDAVVRNGLADHWRESYVGEMGKSTTATYARAVISDWLNCEHSRISLIGEVTMGVRYSG